MEEAIRILPPRVKPPFIDEWIPEEEDKIFRFSKNAIILPVSQFYGDAIDDELNSFILSKKKCYNKPNMHVHITNYLNYFLKYYDTDKELLAAYYMIKILIDYEKSYSEDNFMFDICTYLMSRSILEKVELLVEDNYSLDLNYTNSNNPSLQYTNRHAKILMAMSVVQNLLIPISTHFTFINNLDANEFLLKVFDIVLNLSDVDMCSKLYDTSTTNVIQGRKMHNRLWEKQDIRGKNLTTHAMYCVDNIILNIMPKYTFSENIISFNFTSIKNNTEFQITAISYEFTFSPFSSSNRDDDCVSDFDRFESFLVVQNEGLYLQNKVNCEDTVKRIEYLYGPFDDKEIDFYLKSLSEDSIAIINDFQKTLISNLFYKYFGEPVSFNAINKVDYVKLMIAAKRLLIANKMVILPYIISSKVRNVQNRKNVNKKEFIKLTQSPYYQQISAKYNSTKMRDFILSLIATILSSEFKIIDYEDEFLNGKNIEVIPDIILDELLMYVLLV